MPETENESENTATVVTLHHRGLLAESPDFLRRVRVALLRKCVCVALLRKAVDVLTGETGPEASVKYSVAKDIVSAIELRERQYAWIVASIGNVQVSDDAPSMTDEELTLTIDVVWDVFSS